MMGIMYYHFSKWLGETCTQNQNLTRFVRYLKIINTVLKNDIIGPEAHW